MTDDWSLKDVKRYPVTLTGEYDYNAVAEADIETLRQKLILDLIETGGGVYHYLVDEDRLLAIRTIKDIINKRFGKGD